MPDLDLRPSASFISSKEGETPSSARRRLMKVSNSCCLRVSMSWRSRSAEIMSGTKQKQDVDVLGWFAHNVKGEFTRSSRQMKDSDPSAARRETKDRNRAPGGRRGGAGRADDEAVGARQQGEHRAVLLR